MTEQQKLDMLRQVLQVIGTLMTTLGFFGADVVATWINTIMQVAGPTMIFVGFVWGLFTNKASSVITQVANMDEVKKVELEPGRDASSLSAATPGNVTVAATH